MAEAASARAPEALTVSAPATSANLGPGFDCLAVALDLGNAVVITRRPGPLEVHVTGEGAGEVPEDASNLVCRALQSGLGSLDGLAVECRNRIPLGRGLGSSAAAVCSGLVAANALGGLRWTPDDLLARAAEMEGHADNAAACLLGGLVAVGPGPSGRLIAVPEELAFVVVIPESRIVHRRRPPRPAGRGAAGRRRRDARQRRRPHARALRGAPRGPARPSRGPPPRAAPRTPDAGHRRPARPGGRRGLPRRHHLRLRPLDAPVVPPGRRRRCGRGGRGGARRRGRGGEVRPSRRSAAGVRARWTGGSGLRLARAVG